MSDDGPPSKVPKLDQIRSEAADDGPSTSTNTDRQAESDQQKKDRQVKKDEERKKMQ